MCALPYNKYGFSYTLIRSKEFNEWVSEQPVDEQLLIDGRLDAIIVGNFGNHHVHRDVIRLDSMTGMIIYIFIFRHKKIVALIGGYQHGKEEKYLEAKKIREDYLNGTRPL